MLPVVVADTGKFAFLVLLVSLSPLYPALRPLAEFISAVPHLLVFVLVLAAQPFADQPFG